MKNIKVLLADDHTIVRQGIRSLLEQSEDIEVVAEAEDGKEAVKKVIESAPDVVLMDIGMPILNGIEATQQIKKQLPDTKVLILTMHVSEKYALQIFRAGGSGYLDKKTAHRDLITAIRAAHKGESFLSPSITKKVIVEYVNITKDEIETEKFDRLTEREREVLQLIAEARSNREIAELLCVSVKTVETHKANLMKKLDIHTTVDIVKFAIRKGMIRLE